jgi:acyl-CoA thioester hydrolase
MGVVYYANYLVYMEAARTTLLREDGVPYAEMEKAGYLLPVTECHVKYLGAAHYDEEISVETTLAYIKNASVKFLYTIRNESGKEILNGYTVHPIVSPEWKIIPVPEEIRELLLPYVKG